MTFGFDGYLASRISRSGVNEPSDLALPHYRLAPQSTRKIALNWALRKRNITHLVNESNFPLLGNPHRRRFTDELTFWAARGVASAIVFHGSDARDPDLSMELSRHSYFHDAEPAWVERLRQQSRWNRETALDAQVPLFVTTPDMLRHVPDATFLPISVDPWMWKNNRLAFSDSVPTVLHRPAANNSPIKSSKYILPILEKLEHQKKIRLLRAAIVAHDEMNGLIAESDIVVDQLQTGAYGVTAVEAMAAGRLVVADLSDAARDVLGPELPVVNASPTTFAEVMDAILDDTATSIRRALSGPSFVAKWHDGTAAVQALGGFVHGTSQPGVDGERQ